MGLPKIRMLTYIFNIRIKDFNGRNLSILCEVTLT